MLFLPEIKLRLLELYKANKERLEPTSHDKSANSTLNSAWQQLTTTLNQEYPGLNVDVTQVKNCHKGLKKSGKEELVKAKRYT
jgi:hypothetical protein